MQKTRMKSSKLRSDGGWLSGCKSEGRAMRRTMVTMCLLGAVSVTGDARAGSVFAAGDEALFAGVIPGEVLSTEELDIFWGRGVPVHFNLGEETTFTLDLDTVTLSNESVFSDNRGLFQTVSISGDQNNVSVEIYITVNLNTVTIADSERANILVNQRLGFDGAISALEP